MNEDERAILQAQAAIYAGLVIANAIYASGPRYLNTDDDPERTAQGIAHMLAQNLDLHTGKP
jgi:hypothetical protein